jgi:hypothetical protein
MPMSSPGRSGWGARPFTVGSRTYWGGHHGPIRKIRLEQAAWLLEQGTEHQEITYAVGSRVAHFSSSFKEHHGATPSAYRQSPR